MPRLRLRILFDQAMLGPGKVELLLHIAQTGSIAAAGRNMGMSYKRAWSLVEEMNRAFDQPLVCSARGGTGGGGAALTAQGRRVTELYHGILQAADDATRAQISELQAMLRPDPAGEKQRLP